MASGARALESLLLEDLEPLARAPERLALTARVIVPSRSLREHLQCALVARAGRAVAGVRVQTLYGAALEILERAERARPVGDALLPVLVRRAAREQHALREALDDLHDGYAGVTGTVRDLLDAGFTSAERAALEAAIDAAAARPLEARRARAIVAVADAVRGALLGAGRADRSELYREAARCLETGGERALPSSAVLVHGFADATGVATGLIAALGRECGAVVYLDRPPDPAAPAELDGGIAFTRRFCTALGLPDRVELEPSDAAPGLHLLRAPGMHAEARAVAGRIARLIAQGERPESIGVVVRQLEPWRVPLRVQLTRAGVPWSGVASRGTLGPAGRRLRGLVELLRAGAGAPAGLWLGLLGAERLPRADRADARAALQAAGAARMADAAALSVGDVLRGRAALPLPVRRGLVLRDGRRSAPRREVGPERLGSLLGGARRIVGLLRDWPARAPAGEHAARLARLLEVELCWHGDASPAADADAVATGAAAREVHAALAGLVAECGEDWMLERGEWLLLVERALATRGADTLGGQGGGVQVLDVTGARGRTFSSLFLLGMNRDVFPRTIQEDPLLPDALRGAMSRVLPQLPRKETGFAEERFLFAQLLSSSPEVTLSWQSADDDGKPRAPSPLIVRLQLQHAGLAVEQVPSLYAREAGGPRSAIEQAILAGLHGARVAFPDHLEPALREAGDASDARARMRVLDEQDPDPTRPEGWRLRGSLGPYFGFVGSPRAEGDPRRDPLHVTTAEALAHCAWRAFVERVLRLAPPGDVLESLPEIDALLIGTTTHGALEAIARNALDDAPRDLEGARGAPVVTVAWPGERALEELLEGAAARALRSEGIALPGLARVLALCARPFVDVAREHAGLCGGAVVGVELRGVARTEAGEVHFKVDRLDREDGRAVLTDYKTGKPMSDGVKAETRRTHLIREIARGRALQVGAYALALPGAAGRYLYLHPDLKAELREVRVDASDTEALATFQGAFATVAAAWSAGSFFPRLVDPPKGNARRSCEQCDVAPACLHGDSGARARLETWGSLAPDAPQTPVERAARALFELPGRSTGSAA